eukprot:2921079-Rhodomonas_salina.2
MTHLYDTGIADYVSATDGEYGLRVILFQAVLGARFRFGDSQMFHSVSDNSLLHSENLRCSARNAWSWSEIPRKQGV